MRGMVQDGHQHIWNCIPIAEFDGEMSNEQEELVLDLDSHFLNCAFSSCGAI